METKGQYRQQKEQVQGGHGQRDRARAQHQDQLPAASGNQTEGHRTGPACYAEIQGKTGIQAGHAQGGTQRHEKLDQDDEQAIENLLKQLSAQQEQQPPHHQLQGDEQGTELP